MFFLGIISWKVVSSINGDGCFSDGGLHFIVGGASLGVSVWIGGGFEKHCWMGAPI